MGTIEENVGRFIQECAKKGKSSPKDICAEAHKRLQEIADEMRRMQELRNEEAAMKQILKSFQDPSERRPKTRQLSGKIADANGIIFPELLPTVLKVVEYVENAKDQIKPHDIIRATAGMESSAQIYMIIKYLSGIGVLYQNDDIADRFISKGPRWENRPKAA